MGANRSQGAPRILLEEHFVLAAQCANWKVPYLVEACLPGVGREQDTWGV